MYIYKSLDQKYLYQPKSEQRLIVYPYCPILYSSILFVSLPQQPSSSRWPRPSPAEPWRLPRRSVSCCSWRRSAVCHAPRRLHEVLLLLPTAGIEEFIVSDVLCL